MKAGRSLVELAQELQRQTETKRDFDADTRQVRMVAKGLTVTETAKPLTTPARTEPVLALEGVGEFGITPVAHTQIAERVGIPQKYYDRMVAEAPELLAENVNHWFGSRPEKRMVRTLDGRARAFLSIKYRPLDNVDLAEAVLPKLIDSGAEVVSSELTDTRFYVKAITQRVQGEVRVGDVMHAGVVISNSEVGLGALRVSHMIYRLTCRNGAIRETALRQSHVGRGNGHSEPEGVEVAREFFRTETLAADDRAFWLKVTDTVAAMLSQTMLDQALDSMREAGDRKIAEPLKIIERVATRLALTDGEKNGVLAHLIEGRDLSAYGLMNAITRASQDVADYDRATELETAGFGIIELPRHQWETLAAA